MQKFPNGKMSIRNLLPTQLNSSNFYKIVIMNNFQDLIYKQEKSSLSILIVTHGGVIREFLKILIDEMDSEIPPGKEPKENYVGFDRFGAIKNTCWSRFEVSLSGDDKLKALKCVNLLSNDHLD